MKRYLALFFILLVLMTAIGCANTVETEETTTEKENIPLEEFTPETVDTLTDDFNEMQW